MPHDGRGPVTRTRARLVAFSNVPSCHVQIESSPHDYLFAGCWLAPRGPCKIPNREAITSAFRAISSGRENIVAGVCATGDNDAVCRVAGVAA